MDVRTLERPQPLGPTFQHPWGGSRPLSHRWADLSARGLVPHQNWKQPRGHLVRRPPLNFSPGRDLRVTGPRPTGSLLSGGLRGAPRWRPPWNHRGWSKQSVPLPRRPPGRPPAPRRLPGPPKSSADTREVGGRGAPGDQPGAQGPQPAAAPALRQSCAQTSPDFRGLDPRGRFSCAQGALGAWGLRAGWPQQGRAHKTSSQRPQPGLPRVPGQQGRRAAGARGSLPPHPSTEGGCRLTRRRPSTPPRALQWRAVATAVQTRHLQAATGGATCPLHVTAKARGRGCAGPTRDPLPAASPAVGPRLPRHAPHRSLESRARPHVFPSRCPPRALLALLPGRAVGSFPQQAPAGGGPTASWSLPSPCRVQTWPSLPGAARLQGPAPHAVCSGGLGAPPPPGRCCAGVSGTGAQGSGLGCHQSAPWSTSTPTSAPSPPVPRMPSHAAVLGVQESSP